MLQRILPVLLACSVTLAVAAQDDGPRVPHQVAWRSTTQSDAPPVIGLARTARRYREALVPQHDPAAEAPAVADLDLARHDALLVSWGTKPTGGYAVAATAVSAEADRATVVLRCTAPEPGAPTTQAITNPSILVLVPKRQRLEIRLTGDRPAAGVDFSPTAGDGFTVIDDRRDPAAE